MHLEMTHATEGAGASVAPVLSVSALTKRYRGGQGITDASIEVAPSALVGVIGPNGSGKTTLVHSIVGLLEPDAGEVLIDRSPAADLDAKSKLGFVPDELPLPSSLSGNEFIDYLARLQPGFDSEWKDYLCEILGLTDHLARFIGDYSHGMKKKIQFVAALAHTPRLLVLDEPFRGLDPEAAICIRALIDAHRARGGGVLVATHDLLFAEQFCTSVVILADQRVAASGHPAALREESGAASLEEVFLRVSGLASQVLTVESGIAARFPVHARL